MLLKRRGSFHGSLRFKPLVASEPRLGQGAVGPFHRRHTAARQHVQLRDSADATPPRKTLRQRICQVFEQRHGAVALLGVEQLVVQARDESQRLHSLEVGDGVRVPLLGIRQRLTTELQPPRRVGGNCQQLWVIGRLGKRFAG